LILINQQANINFYSMLRVVVIEDEFFAANHLSKLINSLNFDVVGVYHSGEEFLKETSWAFDIAVIDIFLADTLTGYDVAKYMNEMDKPFIFLTANQDSETVKKATSLSPSAYISKPFKPNDVEAALVILSIKINQKKGRTYDILLKQNQLSSEPLTIREIEVLQKLVENRVINEISAELFISPNTVKYHFRNIFQKLNSNSRIEVQEKVLSFFKY
jgi:DNA-binding NarL/FixJ family response regulator